MAFKMNNLFTILSASMIATCATNVYLEAGQSGKHHRKEHCDNSKQHHHHFLPGSYFVCGTDPYENVDYQGLLIITLIDENIYNFEWTYAGGSVSDSCSGVYDTGTGIYDPERNVFAVTFTTVPGDLTYTGPMLYKIHDGQLYGEWTMLGDLVLVGREVARKLKDCIP